MFAELINDDAENLRCCRKMAGALDLHQQVILRRAGHFVHPQDKKTHGGVATSKGKEGRVGLPILA